MEEELIPGLPDELARECLVRLSYDRFSSVRAVCKLWRQEIESPFFHKFRDSTGWTRSLIVLAQAELSRADYDPARKSNTASTPTYRLTVFEPESGAWATLPPIPGLPRGLPLFCQLVSAGKELFVLGGWNTETWAASKGVFIYNFVSGEWRRGSNMPVPRRSFFGCGAGAGIVLVAGGHDEEKNALNLAAAYEIQADRWVDLPSMEMERDECKCVFMNNKFYVIGGYSTDSQGRFGRSAEAFNLHAWEWEQVDENKLEYSTSPRTCTTAGNGRLFMCSPEGKVVAEENGAWKTLAELPGDVRVAPQLMTWKNTLAVMGSGSHGGELTAYVLDEVAGAWKKKLVPPEFAGHVQALCSLEI